jgi:hypothetical protein
MRPIGEVVSLRPRVPSKAGSMPASLRASADKPALIDHEADVEIPRRLWSNFIPEFGSRTIVRALTTSEREALEQRKVALTTGMLPFAPEQRQEVDDAIPGASAVS